MRWPKTVPVGSRLDGQLIHLGSVARRGAPATPVITPPNAGRYTIVLQGARGQQRMVRLMVASTPDARSGHLPGVPPRIAAL
jgi:hypothetical protein